MADVDFQVVTRGLNPAPAGGWSWNLTDYEVGYVREFNVRPVRDAWLGTPEDNARLDQEADGVRRGPQHPVNVPRRHPLWLWLAVSGLMVTAGAVAMVLGVMNVTAAATLNEKTSSIEVQL